MAALEEEQAPSTYIPIYMIAASGPGPPSPPDQTRETQGQAHGPSHRLLQAVPDPAPALPLPILPASGRSGCRRRRSSEETCP